MCSLREVCTAGSVRSPALARAARRAERLVTELAAQEPVSAIVIAYLNRLSDLFFVLARACNDNGAGDVLWVPGANR